MALKAGQFIGKYANVMFIVYHYKSMRNDGYAIWK